MCDLYRRNWLCVYCKQNVSRHPAWSRRAELLVFPVTTQELCGECGGKWSHSACCVSELRFGSSFCNMKHICVDPQSEISGGFYQRVTLKSECRGSRLQPRDWLLFNSSLFSAQRSSLDKQKRYQDRWKKSAAPFDLWSRYTVIIFLVCVVFKMLVDPTCLSCSSSCTSLGWILEIISMALCQKWIMFLMPVVCFFFGGFFGGGGGSLLFYVRCWCHIYESALSFKAFLVQQKH